MKHKNTRRGRPKKPYQASWGEHINGLRNRGGKRWVIVETGETFTEPDERLAVARYRQWEAARGNNKIALNTDSLLEINFKKLPNGKHQINTKTMSTVGWVTEAELWVWFREQLISRPEYVADQVGIPEVARLADLPKLEASPTLKEIGQLHFDKSDAQRKQRRQTQLFWGAFMTWMKSRGVTTLRQLTPALMAEYSDHAKTQAKNKAKGKGGSPKYLKHRFMSIRGVVNFAQKRGVHSADVRHALDCCAVLESPKRSASLNPRPMPRDAVHRLLDYAPNPRMKAYILVMLNFCMKPGAALGLDWGDLDLKKRTLVTDRRKTTVPRVAIIWPRTVEALRVIQPPGPGKHDPVFISKHGTRWSDKAANKQYRQLRTVAGVDPEIKCEDLRDAAYTTAIESGADLLSAKLLAGHRTGIPDHYAKRSPGMVADIVKAIERAYFGTDDVDSDKCDHD